MKIPTITGIIERRILLNYRVAPEVAEKILPAPFRPKLLHGCAIAGICLIRLKAIRPKSMPGIIGISSENSAHRIAVEWQDKGQLREGVFVPRRDTNSRLNSWAGGRLFPGVHQLSRFTVTDQNGEISLQVDTDPKDSQKSPLLELQARESEQFPSDSIFAKLEESSRFFEAGCVGYSSRPNSCTLDGLLLQVSNWRVSPLHVKSVHSAYFDDQSIFPTDAIEFDHALLMRDIPHQWHSEPTMNSNQRRN